MAATNRKRSSGKSPQKHPLWGSLFKRRDDEGDALKKNFYPQTEEDELEPGAPMLPLHMRMLQNINAWAIATIAIFLIFTISLLTLIIKMWIPQELKSIPGYTDNGSARDLAAIINNANGREVSFTEAELNRYLRDTCRMQQTGIFSIFAHGQGIAVRVHDGYAELILDRIIGANMHQTTSVHLSFRQVVEHGRPQLEVDMHGGEPIIGGTPCGGSIGSVRIPQRHIQMLRPALKTLIGCYPQIAETMEEHGYFPIFTKGANGMESRIQLIPYTPST